MGMESFFRFDGQFILEWMLKQGTTPEVIPCGGKLMSIRMKSAGISVIDSLNFLPMPLSKLPSSFGLSEMKKGYFPHLFNTRENQGYVGPLPEARFYSPDTMTSAVRNDFLSWHEEHKGDVFNFQQEMLTYCRYLFYSCILLDSIFIPVCSVCMIFIHGFLFYFSTDQTWTFSAVAAWSFGSNS